MRRILLAAILVVTTGVPLAAADTWTTAYKRGDYTTAATLLQRAVFEHPGTQAPDPAALKQLALLYGDGKGVERDPVLACGLLRAHATATAGRQGSGRGRRRRPSSIATARRSRPRSAPRRWPRRRVRGSG